MTKLAWKSHALILITLYAACALARPVAGQAFQITDLGFLPGASGFTRALAINNAGQIVGSAIAGAFATTDAFLWSPAVPNGVTGSIKEIGALSAAMSDSQANAINGAGQVVGVEDLNGAHAFSFRNGVLTDLGIPPNFVGSNATGINSAGQIVGNAFHSDLTTHAFLISGGKTTDLGTLPGGTFSTAVGINDAGEIIGTADNAAGVVVPIIVVNGVIHDMSGPGGISGLPTAINNAGQVAGVLTITIHNPDNEPDTFLVHGTLWTPATPNGLTGTVEDFGEGSSTTAINGAGVLLGTIGDASTTVHPVVRRNGAFLDLNGLIPGDSGVKLVEAVGINDAGQIAANGTLSGDFSGSLHAFLLTPIAGPTIPSIPANVVATAGNASVTLTWSTSLQATSYKIHRATSNAGPFATIATITAPTTQFVDKTAHNGVGYYYFVTAVNSVGESPRSLLAAAFPLPNPTNLTATAGAGQIVLKWRQPVGIVVGANIIYRAVGNGPLVAIAALDPTTTFTDTQVVAGLSYTYQVTADASNFGFRETPPSNTASATAR